MILEEFINVPYTTKERLQKDTRLTMKEIEEGLTELEKLNLIRVLPDGKIIDLETTFNILCND